MRRLKFALFLCSVGCVGLAKSPNASLRADETDRPQPAAAAQASPTTDADQPILKALAERNSFDFQETPLQDIVQHLREQTKLNILIDRRALDDYGISPEVAVSADLKDISLRSALNLILQPLDLTWSMENGVLIITTAEVAETKLTTKVYRVADLVMHQGRRDDHTLLELIMATISRETWSEAGGPASVNAFRDTFVITQTNAEHEQIAHLLQALRDGRKATQQSPHAAPSPAVILLGNGTNQAMQAALQQRISLEENELPLHEMLQVLREKLGVQIVVDTRALDDVGLATDVPVSLSVQDLPARQTLHQLLQPVDLTWVLANEVVLITTPEEAETILEVRIYPVNDLCANARHRPGLGAMFREGGNDELRTVIMDSLAPASWDEMGGSGSIASLPSAGVIAVAQTAEVHDQIERLLHRLRQQVNKGEAVEQAQGPAPEDEDAYVLIVYGIPAVVNFGGVSGSMAPQSQNDPEPQPELQEHLANLGGFGGIGMYLPPIPGEDLAEVITTLVEPDRWGEDEVYLKVTSGRLIVRHTVGAHRKIQDLLATLGVDAQPIERP